MIYYLASILAITLICAFLYRAKVISVCPICAGVVLTWVVGVTALYTNQSWANPMIIAILLGASMGAFADKYGARFGLVWKSLMVLLGLPAIYFIVERRPWLGLGLLLVLAVATLLFSSKEPTAKFPHQDMFKECC